MMTEKTLFAKIKPLLNAHGIASRLENAIGSGLPDVVYVTARHIMFIELKIVRSGKIYLRPFQYSYAMQIQPYVSPKHMWYLCEDKGDLKLYMFKSIKDFIINEPDAANRLTVDMRGIKPDHMLTNSLSVMQWVLYIKAPELKENVS